VTPLRALRVLRDEPAPAAWNMAVDEALLTAADVPTLRLYGFRPHAVSLGYFQRCADFADLPHGTPIVRRLTGGGAIHHGDEITFSLALPAELLPRDVAASYRVLHDAALGALASIGVPGERVADGDAQAARPAERWCFRIPGRDDVVSAAGKLLGSAQRRIAAPQPRVLHHGSLVVRRPALTPFTAAVADHVEDADAAARTLRDALVDSFAAALGLRAMPGVLTDRERALATRLERERYAAPAFLRQR
jgi:lipoate-protein ligase A